MADPFKFTLGIEDFDVALLPESARDRAANAFRDAVKTYLQNEFHRLGGWSEVHVDTKSIEVTWTPDQQPPDPLEQIIGKLQRGDYPGAVTLLQLLLSDRPHDVTILYNLGMALSDVGRFSEAEAYLRRAVNEAPGHTNAWVALGVALQRQTKTDEAIDILAETVARAPTNVWAHRNLGACLLATGRVDEAEQHLREATRIEPRDQHSWLGLARALEAQGRTADADGCYRKVIDVDEYSQIAEMARQSLSRIAHASFRDRAGGIERPDAIMYCVGALERFEQMTPEQVRQVAFEIAVLGQQGFDVNDPAQRYRLTTLQGSFSGLHLVCLMYVAFKQIAPERDVGFDVSREYAAARDLHQPRKG
jgi:Flp pilus assembly protein TadD